MRVLTPGPPAALDARRSQRRCYWDRLPGPDEYSRKTPPPARLRRRTTQKRRACLAIQPASPRDLRGQHPHGLRACARLSRRAGPPPRRHAGAGPRRGSVSGRPRRRPDYSDDSLGVRHLGSEETPWVGAGLIKGFRDHHVDPQSIVLHDWIEVNGAAGLAAAAGFLLFSPLAWQLASGGQIFWYASLWSLICVAAAANQLHKWAHIGSPPALVRGLQRLGAILSADSHAQHHRTSHTRHYCISLGWLNSTLDTIRFWRGLERCVEAVMGAEARSSMEKT